MKKAKSLSDDLLEQLEELIAHAKVVTEAAHETNDSARRDGLLYVAEYLLQTAEESFPNAQVAALPSA